MTHFGSAKSIVIAASGGIDSTVLAHLAAKHELDVTLFHGDFEKPSSQQELAAVRRVAHKLRFPTEIVNFSSLTKMQLGFVHPIVIATDEYDVKGRIDIAPSHPVSGYYVFLSAAAYFAQITEYDAVVTGLIKEQTEGRPELDRALQLFQEFLKEFNPDAKQLQVLSPLLSMNKAEVIRLGSEIGVDFSNTWSCGALVQSDKHCGVCNQCKARKGAFHDAGIEDVTEYAD